MEKNIVTINKKTASNTKSIEVNGDIIVPDIKPDIVNIITASGIPYIYKEEISKGRVRFDGNIDTYIVYLADNGDTRSIQTTLSFSDSIEEAGISEKGEVKQRLILESIEAKVLNERKLNIKANLKVKTEVFEKSQIEIGSDFENLSGIEKLKETIDIKSIVGCNKVKTSAKEDIKIEEGYSIAEILKTNIEVENCENKISYNKVLAKADAQVKIVFLSEDGRIGVASGTIPVMSFIDIEKVTDTNICNTEYFIRNVLFKVNSGEARSITCQIDFEVMCEACEVKTINIIQDMYGIRNKIEFSKKDIDVEVNRADENERININERVQVEDILKVCDVSVSPRIVRSNKNGEFINCECEAGLNIYYEANNRNGLNTKSITFPFIVKNIQNEEDLNFEVTRKQFTVSNENVNCDIEISVQKCENRLKRITIIDDVKQEENEEEEDYKMCMYFVKPGDTIWKIAKKFRVSMCDLIAINKLDYPDKINVGDRLYIMR